MTLEELQGKKFLILGYGIEGKATLKFLKHHLPDIQVGIADQKDGGDYLEKQKDYDFVIKSPSIPKKLVTIPYTTATNIFFANVKGMIIGVTGSKGKSTTTSLIYAMLKEAGLKAHVAGNIGNPLLSELLKGNDKDDIFVCELSSFQLDDITYSPHISVLLNLYPGHMDYHGNIEEYYKAKKKIISKAKADDYFVYNPALEEVKKLALQTKAKAVPFIKTLSFDDSIIPLLGKHNQDNMRAAVTVVKVLGVKDEDITQAVKNFKTLKHRLEFVGTFRGIRFYDDAIGTIPEATIAAVASLDNIGTIFLGGQDKGYDFEELIEVVVNKKIPNIVFFPDTGEKLLRILKEKTKKLPKIFETTSMEKAIKFAYANTPVGSVCLLSCASPSYSVWKNFEEKGDLFQKFVKQYGE